MPDAMFSRRSKRLRRALRRIYFYGQPDSIPRGLYQTGEDLVSWINPSLRSRLCSGLEKSLLGIMGQKERGVQDQNIIEIEC